MSEEMINLTNLHINEEYYFYFLHFYCTGFVKTFSDSLLQLKNGNFYYNNSGYPYEDASFSVDQIVGYAKT